MALTGQQSTFQRQASMGRGNSGSVGLPLTSTPSVSLQEQDTLFCTSWTHNAHDSPYDCTNLAQMKSRKPTDNTDCDDETDLQGLVSNILDDADPQDFYYNEGNSPTCNPSPKTLPGELLQHFWSGANSLNSCSFQPMPVAGETYNEAQRLSAESLVKDVDKFSQQLNNLATNQQWPINLPNGDRDSFTSHPQKMPPGLLLPQMGNTYLSRTQHSKNANMSVDRTRINSQPMNNFHQISDVFRPQIETSKQSFNHYYEDQYTRSSARPGSNDQHVPQDINQLVRSFQSFGANGHDSVSCEDSVEQWKVGNPVLLKHNTPSVHLQKQLVGQFGAVLKDRHEGMRKQTLKHDCFQDLPVFSSQNKEQFRQAKTIDATFDFQNPSKITMNRQSTSVPMSLNMSQYSNHHFKQNQKQNKIKPHMLEERKGMENPGLLGGEFFTGPPTITYNRQGDKKQAVLQNSHSNLRGSVQGFDGENSRASLENIQQFRPAMYPVNYPGDYSRLATDSSNLNSRHTSPGSSGKNSTDMMCPKEGLEFNAFLSDTAAHTQESKYEMDSDLATPQVMNQRGCVMELHLYLDNCYEQWKCLEKERQMTESILSPTFPENWTATVTDPNLPKMPPNPTKVDHLIIDQIREQAKVKILLERMEFLQDSPLHPNIHTALQRHQIAISTTQGICKEEFGNISKHQWRRADFTEDRDNLLLITALKDLTDTTKRLRKALWCAAQMTGSTPVMDQAVDGEDTHAYTQSSPSPLQGYSFKL